MEKTFAIKISIDCIENKGACCGKPKYFGFDFFVKTNEDTKKIVDEITELLNEKNIPIIKITVERSIKKDYYKIWNLEMIQECINNSKGW